MKNKVVIFILSVLILLMVGFILFFDNYLKSNDKLSIKIDNQIKNEENNIILNNNKLNKKISENNIKYKNVENMNNYIDSLNKRIKQYE